MAYSTQVLVSISDDGVVHAHNNARLFARVSMCWKVDCQFFGEHLEDELAHHQYYAAREGIVKEIAQYIQDFAQKRRRQARFRILTPVNYEQNHRRESYAT